MTFESFILFNSLVTAPGTAFLVALFSWPKEDKKEWKKEQWD